MSTNSVSFTGSNKYTQGTCPTKPKTKRQEPQRQFKTYDMRRNFTVYHEDYDLKYIPVDRKPADIDRKKLTCAQAVRKQRRRKAEQRAKLIATLIPTIPASILATYFTFSNPQKEPAYTPVVETVDIDKIINANNVTIPASKIFQEVEALMPQEIYDIEQEIQNDEEAEEFEDEPISAADLYDGAFAFNLCLNDEQEKGVRKFIEIWNNPEKRQRYINVSNQTGIPAELIAAIHFREGSGNFNKSQVNGALLEDTNFANWEESAVYAFTKTGQDLSLIKGDDINSWYDFAESYNGYGYRKFDVNTPYVWSGTTLHKLGKFTVEHEYSATAPDDQPGVAVMLREVFVGDVLPD